MHNAGSYLSVVLYTMTIRDLLVAKVLTGSAAAGEEDPAECFTHNSMCPCFPVLADGLQLHV